MQRLIITLFAAVLLVPAATHAQAWPAKPIRFVLPFGPGSATDALARIAGEDLSRSPADGYTFLFGSNSPLAVVPNVRKEMVATLGKQSVKDAMLKHGFMAKSSTPEALTTYLREQLEIWKTALKTAGDEQQ